MPESIPRAPLLSHDQTHARAIRTYSSYSNHSSIGQMRLQESSEEESEEQAMAVLT